MGRRGGMMSGEISGDHAGQARAVAADAMAFHHEGIEMAFDHQAKTISDVGDEDGMNFEPYVRHVPTGIGLVHLVSISGVNEEGNRYHMNDIMVATREDPMKVTDNAAATPVSWSTRVSAIIDVGGEMALAELWTRSAIQVVQ